MGVSVLNIVGVIIIIMECITWYCRPKTWVSPPKLQSRETATPATLQRRDLIGRDLGVDRWIFKNKNNPNAALIDDVVFVEWGCSSCNHVIFPLDTGNLHKICAVLRIMHDLFWWTAHFNIFYKHITHYLVCWRPWPTVIEWDCINCNQILLPGDIGSLNKMCVVLRWIYYNFW